MHSLAKPARDITRSPLKSLSTSCWKVQASATNRPHPPCKSGHTLLHISPTPQKRSYTPPHFTHTAEAVIHSSTFHPHRRSGHTLLLLWRIHQSAKHFSHPAKAVRLCFCLGEYTHLLEGLRPPCKNSQTLIFGRESTYLLKISPTEQKRIHSFCCRESTHLLKTSPTQQKRSHTLFAVENPFTC